MSPWSSWSSASRCRPRRPSADVGARKTYADRLFLQALVIMIVRRLHTVHELLSVLAQPTAEMQTLRGLLTVDGRFPCRRTWERRLTTLPDTLPAQIGCLGRTLVALLQPWAHCGRAVAIDSTVLAGPRRRVACQASRCRRGAAYVD